MMTEPAINHVEISILTIDKLNCETVDLQNNISSIEMKIDNSYLNETQRLKVMFRYDVKDVYKTEECKELMNFLRRISSTLLTNEVDVSISDLTDNENCIEFFRNYLIIAMDNCSDMLANIAQRQYINLIKFVMAIWNMSDKFDSLCIRMVGADVHICLIRLLGKINITQSMLESRQILVLCMSIVGILHNIIRKTPYSRSQYRNENVVRYLMPLAALEISEETVSLKTAALLLLGFLVNENENNALNAKDDHIIYILDILKATLTSPELYSSYYGYHCLEILHSLRNVASPDPNKRSLVNNGILSLIGIILDVKNEEKYPEEVVAALELLWSLSFSKECLLALDTDVCELKNRVETLAQSTNQNIILSARGILWNINNSHGSISFNHLIRTDARTPNVNGHIMISYQHSTQAVMIKIKDKLISNGYRVWMDVDHMRGSFVDAMAEGIQHAAVLLLGMCQAFKNSPHCRQEVKYAYTLGIPLVPIMLEAGFAPDGWLGLMCATLIHTEFIDQDKFELNVKQVQRQLGNLGYSSNNAFSQQDSIDHSYPVMSNHQQCDLNCCKEDVILPQHSLSHTFTANRNMSDSNTDNILMSFKSDHSSALNNQSFISQSSVENQNQTSHELHNRKHLSVEKPLSDCCICNQPELQVLLWTRDDCNNWLCKNDIPVEKYGYPLVDIDGPLLLELADMKLTAPEMFFRAAKEDMKLDFLHTLRLSLALKSLKSLS